MPVSPARHVRLVTEPVECVLAVDNMTDVQGVQDKRGFVDEASIDAEVPIRGAAASFCEGYVEMKPHFEQPTRGAVTG